MLISIFYIVWFNKVYIFLKMLTIKNLYDYTCPLYDTISRLLTASMSRNRAQLYIIENAISPPFLAQFTS